MDEDARTFTATIEGSARGGAFVRVPFDVEVVYGSKRVPVRATFDGVEYRGSLVRMGGDCHVLGVLKEIRERLGKSIGDDVEVVIVVDMEPRVVEVPVDLERALARVEGASAVFDSLSYTRRREYARSVEQAVRPETREARIDRILRDIATFAR